MKKKWLGILGTSILCGSLTIGAMTLANNFDDDNEPIVTTPTEETPITTTPQPQPRERIGFEYYTITEEAVKNSWTCQTIDRCDKNRFMVYIYDPARIGEHKFNIVSGVSFVRADIVVVYVNQYNDILGTETFTLESDAWNRGATIVVTDFPPGTKYVKFADFTNVVYE